MNGVTHSYGNARAVDDVTLEVKAGELVIVDNIAMAEAKMGTGTMWLFGPEILFRTQPHGTYKLFLNALDGGFQRPTKPLQ